MYDFVDKLRHFLAFFAVFCFFYGGTWAQDQSVLTDVDLSKTPYSWLLVSSGSAVCRPIKTSYGWLDLTEGKMASAFTESGAVLWQQGLPAQAAGLACADQDGFAAVLLKGRRLCLLNPSGLVLWQKALDFEPKANPLFGRDGRFFVFGKSEAAAFGMNGVQKWKEKTEPLSATLWPMQLDDGSLLLFLEEAQGSKSVGLRLSPFGALLERIVFSGLVSAACSLENGVLLCFSDGSAGLCSVDKGEAKSKWVIKGLGPGQNPRFFPIDAFRAALAFSGAGGSRLAVINTKKAAAESVFEAADIKGLEYAQAYGDEFFLAAADFGALYTLAGKRTRGASFPARTKKFNWDYVLYGSGGNIIFTSRNWSVAGWRLLKASRQAASESYGSKRKNYKDFYKWLHNICDQWQINDELKNKLDMCGEEIYANIAFYAYPQTEGDIRVAVLKDETQVTLKFADDGIPYNPLEKPDPDITLPPEQRPLGGLGIFMVKEMADDIHYEYKNNSNILTLKFNLQ